MRKLLAILCCLLINGPVFPQDMTIMRHAFVATSGAPNYVNSTGCYSGAATCTTGFNPANGHSLVVWAINDSRTTAISCSDGEGTGNTYTRDLDAQDTSILRWSFFHANSISGSGTYTITCTGSGPDFAIVVVETDKSTLSLTSVSSGSNPDQGTGSGTVVAGSGFTTSGANAFILTAFNDTGGGTTTITDNDGSMTRRQTCTTGASCFVGALSTRTVTSTGSFSGGYTLSVGSEWGFGLAAYS